VISRTFTADHLNEAANHPDVRPYLGHPDMAGPLDLSPLVENPANVCLETEGGGWVLQALLPGAYELHTLFIPEARGADYFEAAREALRFMFTQTDCLEILTKCPDDNPAARMAAVKVGFRERFHRDGVWNVGTEEVCGVSYQALTLDGWLSRDEEISQIGAGLGLQLLTDPDDEFLNRLMGAVVLMMRGGQTAKAVGMFNRAAPFAGYRPIVALRDDLADIGDVLVLVKSGRVEVLLTS
jgi:hypothetical protein